MSSLPPGVLLTTVPTVAPVLFRPFCFPILIMVFPETCCNNTAGLPVVCYSAVPIPVSPLVAVFPGHGVLFVTHSLSSFLKFSVSPLVLWSFLKFLRCPLVCGLPELLSHYWLLILNPSMNAYIHDYSMNITNNDFASPIFRQIVFELLYQNKIPDASIHLKKFNPVSIFLLPRGFSSSRDTDWNGNDKDIS